MKVGKGSLNLQVLRVKVCKRICLRKIKIQFKKRLNYLLAVPEVTYYHVKINIIFFFDNCLAYCNENWLEGFLSKIFFMKIVWNILHPRHCGHPFNTKLTRQSSYKQKAGIYRTMLGPHIFDEVFCNTILWSSFSKDHAPSQCCFVSN